MDDYKEYKVYDAENLNRWTVEFEASAHDAAESAAREWVEESYTHADYGEEFEYETIVDGQFITVNFSVEWEPSFSTSAEDSKPNQSCIDAWEEFKKSNSVNGEVG